jgi:hypothetical protein
MLNFKNKNLILLVVIVALGLIAWGLMRGGSLNKEETVFPKVQYSDNVDKIEISKAGKKMELVKEKDKWHVIEGASKFPADSEAVKSVSDILKDFQFKEIVSENQKKYKDFEVDDDSAYLVKWFVKDKEKGRLSVGKSDYRRRGDYVRVSDKGAVYLTKKSDVGIIFSRLNFKDLTVLSLKKEEITGLDWIYPDGVKVKLVQKQVSNVKKWSLIDKEEKEVSDDKANGVLDALTNLKARDILVFDGKKDYGFAKSFYQLQVSAGSKIVLLTFGKQADEAPAYYTQLPDKTEFIYLVNVPIVNDTLMKKADNFK